MQIQNILAKKGMNFITIHPAKTLRDVVMLLTKHKIGALVVVDDAGSPSGIISERDIIHALDQFGDALKRRVDEVMTRNVIFGAPQDDVKSVEQTMTQKRFRHLPILDQGKLAGIVSITDLVR